MNLNIGIVLHPGGAHPPTPSSGDSLSPATSAELERLVLVFGEVEDLLRRVVRVEERVEALQRPLVEAGHLAPRLGLAHDRLSEARVRVEPHAPPYTIETCLTDLESVRAHYGVNRWVIGGHSWGADLALIYAMEHAPHVAGLICIAGGRVHNDREWHAEYERRKKQEREHVPRFDYPPNMEVNRQLNRSWKRYIQTPELLSAISRLAVPALFVYGERDIRPSWPVEQVARLMPDARFELIEGAEHVIWFSHPNELKPLLRTFVGEVGRRSQPNSQSPTPRH